MPGESRPNPGCPSYSGHLSHDPIFIRTLFVSECFSYPPSHSFCRLTAPSPPCCMMTDFTDRTTCTLPSASHQSKCAGSSVDKIAPTHTRDNPQTDITHADDIPPSRGSTPQEPNIDKDLPDIPSGSKELWGSEPVLERLRSKVVCLPNEVSSHRVSHTVLFFVSLTETVRNFNVSRI